MKKISSPHPAKRDLVFKKIFPAPLSLVWDAWTKSKWIKQWWGPDGFTCTLAKIDFRVDGVSRLGMRAPASFGGQEFFSTWTYVKISELRLIEYVHHLTDKKGRPIEPAAIGMPADFPQGIRHVVAFAELNGNQTALTVTEFDWPMGPMRTMSKRGMDECLEKMAAAISSDLASR